jgi:hypothetical protein
MKSYVGGSGRVLTAAVNRVAANYRLRSLGTKRSVQWNEGPGLCCWPTAANAKSKR